MHLKMGFKIGNGGLIEKNALGTEQGLLTQLGKDLMQDFIPMHQEETTLKNSLFKNTEYLWISWGKAADVVIDLLENKASIHKSETPLGRTSKTKIELIYYCPCIQ